MSDDLEEKLTQAAEIERLEAIVCMVQRAHELGHLRLTDESTENSRQVGLSIPAELGREAHSLCTSPSSHDRAEAHGMTVVLDRVRALIAIEGEEDTDE